MPVSLQSPTEQTVELARWVLLGLNEAELGLVIMHTATGGFTGGLTLLTLGVALRSVSLLSAGIPPFHALFSIGALIGTLIDSYGRVRVLRVSGVAAIVGLVLFGVAPNIVLAAVGIALWGFGAALAFPIGIAAASDDPLKAAARVSVVTAFASMASLAAPPLLGLVAHQIGARYALTLIIIVLVVSVSLAGHAEPTGTKTAAYRPVDSEDDDVKPVETTSDNLAGVVAAEVVSVLQDAPPQPERVPSP